ncbi:hypothetical protein IAQ61_011577 [Plenodomus lingam]|uniref:uncharacterized protein n=1 Tax=Leptosphaeria maculans TaxID=5022 RepID=UPI00331E6E11|nr:hypothetical protein IAQ61_011577 [Plenodomus lingam]
MYLLFVPWKFSTVLSRMICLGRLRMLEITMSYFFWSLLVTYCTCLHLRYVARKLDNTGQSRCIPHVPA